MEYAENLPAPQSKRTLVASLVALVIRAAAATGIWALADDDSSATASGASGPTAGAETPGSQYGTSQYRLTNPPEPVPHPRNPYDSPQYRYPHP